MKTAPNPTPGATSSRTRSKDTPRYRRLYLINSMKDGEQTRIAQKLKCSRQHVSQVLNGKRSQTNDLGINIIRMAEYAATIELGKRSLASFKKVRR